MDYRLKFLYEQMLRGETAKQPLKKQHKNLTDAYEKTKRSTVSGDILEKLKLISGIQNLETLNALYDCYEQIKKNSSFKTNAYILVGSPSSRAYDPTAVLTIAKLQELVNNSDFGEKPLIITYAGNKRKLRTPNGTRIGEWDKIEETDVANLQHALSSNSPKIMKLPAIRSLVILALYESVSKEKIKFFTKLPPGIGAEEIQVDQFNQFLKTLPRNGVKLELPDLTQEGTTKTTFTDAGVLINGAKKIKGVGKADIAFLYNENEVFWISFKEGVYADAYMQKPDAVPGFQQWGSVKTSYQGSAEMKELMDTFLSKCVEQSPNSFKTFDKQNFSKESIVQHLKNENELLEPKKRTNITKDLIQDIEKASVVHITQPSQVLYANLFPTGRPSDSKLTINPILVACFKAIYGLKFDLKKSVNKEKTEFGPENVNIVLETPQPATLTAVMSDDSGQEEPTSVRLNIGFNGHMLKNPDMPHSDKYLPCFYLRRTANERFLFENPITKKSELILCGRALIYTIGRALKEGKTSIDLFN